MKGSLDEKLKRELKTLIVEECDLADRISVDEIDDEGLLFGSQSKLGTRFHRCFADIDCHTKQVRDYHYGQQGNETCHDFYQCLCRLYSAGIKS